MTKKLFAALIAALMTTQAADARVVLNGASFNGATFNGQKLNGLPHNGMKLQGVRIQGLAPGAAPQETDVTADPEVRQIDLGAVVIKKVILPTVQ